ncbi:hypothetical protein [Changpingibacter yushuensis]|uniref:hypothetical protein n=1 Tax=Changpingibacter yushuensis TaxID=2758440 RepID=UPI00165E25DB|nr:hypothetical protein [Changpingibacter yushuensis]
MKVPTVTEALEIYAGDYASFGIVFKREDGTPADMSRFTHWRAQWRRSPGAKGAVNLDLDTSNTIDGKITLIFWGDKTAVDGGEIRSGVFDIQAEDQATIRTLLKGSISWKGDTTR